MAHYQDGSALPEKEGEIENKYTDIDRSQLAAFSLHCDGQILLTIHFDRPDQRLIYRRRVFVLATGPRVFYLVGWQLTIDSENVQSICVLDEETGKVDVIGKWTENHYLFDPVQLIPEESA
jgi:hypothetical protein